MIASGRQTAPPHIEVVSVTSACHRPLEANPRFNDPRDAAPPASFRSIWTSGTTSGAEILQHLAPGIQVDIDIHPGASAPFILSAPEVSPA